MLSLMAQFYRPIEILAFVYRNIREALIDSEQLLSLLTMKPDVKDRPGAPDLFVTRGEIRFDNVTFGYDDTRTILHGISFTVPAGTKCAIVGRTGAGKSTIAKLLFRHFDVTTGTITIDGQDIRAVTQESLRRAVGVVPQDTELFNDTITYNIGYGRTEGSGGSVALPEEIEDAARRAELDESIGKMSDGYETVVGERGLKLSGGEQQRVAIARVLLKDPAILVLDEATSSLDTRTEQAIQTALDGVSASRTTLVIAHRLSTIMNADQIIVLEDGRIAERGTHGALLAQDGLYASMWQRQTA
ncbi:MAG: ATP-binding cassette domain-containing protein [Alphaproteobacteria bacterium]